MLMATKILLNKSHRNGAEKNMNEIKCPKCGLINPTSAMRCDCGYDFGSGILLDTDSTISAAQGDRADFRNHIKIKLTEHKKGESRREIQMLSL